MTEKTQEQVVKDLKLAAKAQMLTRQSLPTIRVQNREQTDPDEPLNARNCKVFLGDKLLPYVQDINFSLNATTGMPTVSIEMHANFLLEDPYASNK